MYDLCLRKLLIRSEIIVLLSYLSVCNNQLVAKENIVYLVYNHAIYTDLNHVNERVSNQNWSFWCIILHN